MYANQNIDDLIEQEVVPRFWNIVVIVEDNHGKNDLRHNYGNAGCCGDPSVDIQGAADIALLNDQNEVPVVGYDLRADILVHENNSMVPERKSNDTCKKSLSAIVVHGLECTHGTHWPPAVGYTDASSAMVKPLQPTMTKQTTMP